MKTLVGTKLAAVIAGLFFLSVIISIPVGCKTNRTAYTSIAATHQATKLAYDGYVDSVIRGETKTNTLPAVAQAYNLFLASERVAIDAAQGNASAAATPDMNSKAATVIQQIDLSKGK